MTEINVGDKVRVEPKALIGYADIEYTVVAVAEVHVGLTSENYDPKKQDSPVQLAVKKEHIKEVISPARSADISATPVPNFKDIRNF